ncbi:hypothetical protein [Acaryochloris sp. IP29b_bin.137]|uniref:hypothetical protein n=1 Tax=Acaryochloris sp. IP29b_bin.137 TaxID=2969217 RepID=UPI00261594E2|nr:hypothetical protein [Acaryochloris sp. IP29b_bin.137]
MKKIMIGGVTIVTTALALSALTTPAQAKTKGFNVKANGYWAKGHCYFGSIQGKCVVKNRKGKRNPKRRKATTEIISFYVFNQGHSAPIKTRCTNSKHCTQKFDSLGYLKKPIGMWSCIRAKNLNNNGYRTFWVGLIKFNRPLGRRTQTMANACQA